MARQRIGNLFVGIGVDLTEFEKGMRQFNQSWGRLGQEVEAAGQQIAMSFGAVSLAIAGGLGYAIKQAATFEQGLSNIKAVSGATGKEIEQLKQLALDMGASTKYSATEAAQGIEELVKAGVSMSDITNGGLKGALSLATAGGLELADAAAIASTALNAFNKESLTVQKAADILAGAANASATDVGELQMGLSQVAAVANDVGLSFEDTSTALAVFAQNGLKGSDAGTSLKTMLNVLQPSTKEQIALFKELGLTTADGSSAFYDSAGNLRTLDQISGILKKSMTGLTAAQRNQTMKTIFGTDAMRAASILFSEGAEGVTKMKKAMSKVTAEQVAAEKMNNLNGAIEQLKGSFETLMISLGEVLVPSLSKVAKFLGKVVDAFNKMSPALKKFIVISATVVAVLTGLIAIVATLAIGLGFLAAAEWAVLAPLLATIGIVVGVIAAIAALGVAIGMLYKRNETFRKTVTAVWIGIKNIIGTVVEALIPVLTDIWAYMKESFMEMWKVLKPAFKDIGTALRNMFSSFGKGTENLKLLKTVVGVVFKFIKVAIGTNMAVAFGVLKVTLSAIVTAFRLSFNALKLTVRLVFNSIKTSIQVAMDVIKGIIRFVTAIIKGDWKGAWDAVKDTVVTIFNRLKTFFANFKTIFKEAGAGLINALVDGIKSAGGSVKDAVKDVAKKIRDFLPFSPAKVGPLSDLDKLDFGGPISDAIRYGTPDVQAQMNSMLSVPDVNPSVMMDNSAGTTVIMQLDGKTIAKSTFAQMGGVFRVRGAVT